MNGQKKTSNHAVSATSEFILIPLADLTFSKISLKRLPALSWRPQQEDVPVRTDPERCKSHQQKSGKYDQGGKRKRRGVFLALERAGGSLMISKTSVDGDVVSKNMNG